MKNSNIFFCSLVVVLMLFLEGCENNNAVKIKQPDKMETLSWQTEFEDILPLLGHRNWILIVDKAFPLQSSQGMKYINTGKNILEVADSVLAKIDQSSHVQAIVYTDAELQFVNENLAPGIDIYKSDLYKMLWRYNFKTLNHEEIFAKLDDASKLFNVVVLKTEMSLPYTSVFIELDCGYWSAEKEAKLRQAIALQNQK